METCVILKHKYKLQILSNFIATGCDKTVRNKTQNFYKKYKTKRKLKTFEYDDFNKPSLCYRF